MEEPQNFGKYISIIQRFSNIYFANDLSTYQIGSGQHFFVLQIFKNPGISLQELAALGCYDKATATRAVRKLEEEGYVRLETDESDKRVRHIFPTEKADAVVEKTRESAASLADLLLDGFEEDERETAVTILKRMAANAHRHITEHKGKE